MTQMKPKTQAEALAMLARDYWDEVARENRRHEQKLLDIANRFRKTTREVVEGEDDEADTDT